MRLATITAETGSKTDAITLAEQALNAYERLAAQFNDHVSYQLESVRIRVNLGTWYRDLGQLDRVRNMLEASISAIENQLAVSPQSRELREVLNNAQRSLGLLEVTSNQLDRADKWFQAAIDTGKELVAEVPEKPSYRCQLAEAHLQLGLLNQKRSRYKEALVQLNSAYEIQQVLVDEDRSVTHHVSILVAIADAIVALYRDWTGEVDDAEKLRLTALDLHKTLASEHPGVVEYQHGLASSHAGLAVFYMNKGNYYVAEPHLQSVRDILERLVSIQPDVPALRSEFGAVLYNLGTSLNQCFRPDDATKALEESARVRRELVAKCPDESAYQFALAVTCNELGRVHSTASHWDESDKALREALGLCERLVHDHGDNVEYQTQLATVTYNLGELSMSRGQPQDAFDRFASTVQILQAQVESSEPPAFSCMLVRNSWYGQARALCQLQRNDEAMQAWQRGGRHGRPLRSKQ